MGPKFCLGVCCVLAACVRLPDTGNNTADERRAGDDAVGYVTISTPLFTPLDDAAQGDSRLEFGELRKESKLAKMLQKPAFGVSRVDYSMLEILLAARLAGTQVTSSSTEKTETGDAPDAGPKTSSSRERTTTFKSPEQPGLPAVPTIPKEVMDEMVALLKSSGTTFQLPPDVLATLVAANKTYMVNLEEYFNVDGFAYQRGLTAEYVPYKVHFTVTAEPGWYSRHYRHDALVEVTFNVSNGAQESDILILAVTPAETAETLNEFTASLNQVALALSVQGSFKRAALDSQVRRLKAAAERLEGMRAGKTLAVGFPDTNRIRIRFQPSTAATKARKDLQTISRVMTAIVLVKNRWNGRALAIQQQWKKGYEEKGPIAVQELFKKGDLHIRAVKELHEEIDKAKALVEASPELRNLVAGVSLDPGALKKACNKYLKKHESGGGGQGSKRGGSEAEREDAAEKAEQVAIRSTQAAALREVARKAAEAEDERAKVATEVAAMQNSFAGRSCTFDLRAYYAPSIWNQSGKWSPPKDWVLFSSRTDRTLVANRMQIASWIPPWLGPLNRKLRVESAFGYYHAKLAPVAAGQAALLNRRSQAESAQRAHAKKKAQLDKRSKELGIAALETRLAAARRELAELRIQLAADPTNPALIKKKTAKEKELAQIDMELRRLGVVLAPLESELGRLLASVVQAKSEVASAETALVTAHAAALRSGKAVVGLAIDSPTKALGNLYKLVFDTAVWARVRSPTGTSGSFQKVGRGPCATVLDLTGMDLGLVLPARLLGQTGSVPLKDLGVIVDIVLFPDGQTVTAANVHFALQRLVQEVILKPGSGARPGASGGRVHAPAPQPRPISRPRAAVPAAKPQSNKIELDLSGVKIELETKPKSAPPAPPKKPITDPKQKKEKPSGK